MRTPVLFLFAILCTDLSLQAQDVTVRGIRDEAAKAGTLPPDTAYRIRRTTGLYGLNLAQGSLKNWAAGGDEFSLSFNAVAGWNHFRKTGKRLWQYNANLNLGYIQTTSLGSRKNDDRFDVGARYGYAISRQWMAGALLQVRTQLFDGYTFGDGTQNFTSSFFSPAYVLLSPGFSYVPAPQWSFNLSPVSARLTIVTNERLSKRGLYGVDSGEHVNTEIGAFVSGQANLNFGPKISYRGRIELFSNYRESPQNFDLFQTNLLAFTITKNLSATYTLDLIYDDDARLFGKNRTSPGLQVKSLIGIGLLRRF